MIIGFMGKAGSGKDTCADFLIKEYNFKRYAFGDPVKETVGAMFGFSNEQLYGSLKNTIDPKWNISPRQAFQIIGTDFAQYIIHEKIPSINARVPKRHLWVKRFQYWYEQHKEIHNSRGESGIIKIVISDVRFKHEIECIKELGGYIIKIERPNIETLNHSSEYEQDTIDSNYINNTIINEGTVEELNKKLTIVIG